MVKDIRGGVAGSYIVTGFFTPNYSDLAETFAANVAAFGIPHHLYAIDAKDWHGATLVKPACVAWARRDYPDATVIAMDVDCRVRGSIDAISTIESDVGINFNGQIRERRPTLYPSTRVTVWRPTAKAGKLLDKWAELCNSSQVRNDEILLMQAIISTPGVAIEALPGPYRGTEASYAPYDDIIVHESAHAKVTPKRRVKKAFRQIRHRLFEQITGMSYEHWKYGARP